MSIGQKFCLHCGRVVNVNGDKCQVCGLPLIENRKESHFLSGYSDLRSEPVELSEGTQLANRFLIKEQIGKGRYGTVYLAEDALREADVALKIIAVSPNADKTIAWQLKQEIKMYCKLSDYKNIISFYDIHFASIGGANLLLMSMEYAAGGTLRKWLVEYRDDLEERKSTGLRYFKEACRGVQACHDAHVIHLDLKPENMIFSGDVLKVSDFGTAKCAHFLQENNDPDYAAGLFDIGTASYMSPEYFTAPHLDELDLRADIYSLGVVLFELLHPKGLTPFTGTPQRLQHLHLNVTAPELPASDEEMSAIVSRCLEKNPEDRYQSVGDLLDDLESPPLKATATTNTDNNIIDPPESNLTCSWKKALQHYSQDDLNETKNLIEEILLENPDHQQAKNLNDEIKLRYDDAEKFYQEIYRNLDSSDLEELVGLITEAASIYPDHPSGRMIQTKLRFKTNQYLQGMENGISALKNESWQSSLIYFQQAQRLNPGDNQLEPIISDLSKIQEMSNEKRQALCQQDNNKARQMESLIEKKIDDLKTRVPAFRE